MLALPYVDVADDEALGRLYVTVAARSEEVRGGILRHRERRLTLQWNNGGATSGYCTLKFCSVPHRLSCGTAHVIRG